jgi:ABC-type phosphate transport system substrate-binding protein
LEEIVMKVKIILIALSLVLISTVCHANSFTLVTNKSNPVSSISAQDAKNIFLGKKSTWENGVKTVVFTQTSSPAHSSFTKNVVGKSTQQFSTFWKKALFTGMGIPPRDLSSDAQMLKAVASQTGTIGYVSADSVDGSVKTVTIR